MNNVITIIPISSFDNSKTRLSPFLNKDERIELLKCMLRDIVSNIKNKVYKIIVISKDVDVLNYARFLGLLTLVERKHMDNFLNNSIIDAIRYVSDNFKEHPILVLPSDIPLISKENIRYVDDNVDDFIIAPSIGGGTNFLYINNEYDYTPFFGEFSFFKHIKEAKSRGMNVNVYDSFYLSVDINTPQDLGELMIHGRDTYTYKYLNSIGIVVESIHGQERLNVYRKDE